MDYKDYYLLMKGNGARESFVHPNVIKNLKINNTSSVLDIGCGGGELLSVIRSRFGVEDLSGIDLSVENVEICKRKGFDVKLVDFIDYLNSSSKKFDFIFMIDVLEHIENSKIKECLLLLKNSLKSNGVLILQTPNAYSPFGMSLRYGDITHLTCFEPRVIEKLSLFAGFSDCETMETGPCLTSFFGLIRILLWRFISIGIYVFNLIEIGNKGTGIFTRTFIARLYK